MMGVRGFSLSEVLGVKDLPDTKAVSDMVHDRTWE